MFKLEFSKLFIKSLLKLSKVEQRAVNAKLTLFKQDPQHPSLRTKRVHQYDGAFALSVNMDIRILWEYADDRTILLLDVGHHDIL